MTVTPELFYDPLCDYLEGCGAVPPLDAATISMDGCITVSLTDLYQYNPDLVKWITEDADAALKWVTDTASQLVRQRIPEVLNGGSAEVHVVGHPQEMPLRKLRSGMIGRLVAASGVVVKITQTEPKLTKARYVCTVCRRSTVVPQRFQYREDPTGKCEDCKGRGSWVLDPLGSVYEDTQMLKLQEAPESMPPGEMPRILIYELHGLLCGSLDAGDRVRLTAVVDASMKGKGSPERTLELYCRCVGVEHLAEDTRELEVTDDESRHFAEMARSMDMFQAVADSVAPSLYGLSDEKKCVAAFLMGGVSTEKEDIRMRGDVSLLLVGDPGLGKSQLLRFASKASPRGVFTTGQGSSAAGLTAAVVKDKDIGFSLEAGAMVLADKGHVVIDELEKMNENDRRAMHPALEQQFVSVNKAGINTTLNARCGVMAAANPKDGRYNPYLTVVQNIDLEAPLINRFDLIRIMRDKPDEERDSALVDHLLKVHSGDTVASPLNLRELRKYIAYCRKHMQPDLPPAVGAQLEEYYKSLRRTTGDDTGDPKQPTIMITPRQFESCIRVTEAIARARLHEVATEDDALTALGIIESSMEQVGVDPSTGERNIDSWMTGKPRGQREKMELLRGIIYEMQVEAPDGYCDYQTLTQKSTEKGLFRVAELRKFVDQLLIEDAQEPVTGKLKILKPQGYTGKQRSLQAQLQKVLQTVGELSGIDSVKDDDLYEALQSKHGMERSEAAKLIGVLMKDGSVYSPRPNYYRRT